MKMKWSLYNLLAKISNTSPWKSSGPFTGPNVRPLGRYEPVTLRTAIFLLVSGSLSTWLKPSFKSPTLMYFDPATVALIPSELGMIKNFLTVVLLSSR